MKKSLFGIFLVTLGSTSFAGEGVLNEAYNKDIFVGINLPKDMEISFSYRSELSNPIVAENGAVCLFQRSFDSTLSDENEPPR